MSAPNAVQAPHAVWQGISMRQAHCPACCPQVRTSWRDHPANKTAVAKLTPECQDLLDKMFEVKQDQRCASWERCRAVHLVCLAHMQVCTVPVCVRSRAGPQVELTHPSRAVVPAAWASCDAGCVQTLRLDTPLPDAPTTVSVVLTACAPPLPPSFPQDHHRQHPVPPLDHQAHAPQVPEGAGRAGQGAAQDRHQRHERPVQEQDQGPGGPVLGGSCTCWHSSWRGASRVARRLGAHHVHVGMWAAQNDVALGACGSILSGQLLLAWYCPATTSCTC